MKSHYDVVVAGGGIAGISAAIKAASLGSSVLLIEHYPFLGGMSAAGMVSPFMKSYAGDQELVKGVYKQIENGIREMGGMIDNGFYAWAFRSVANQLIWQNNGDIAFNSDVIDVEAEYGKINALLIATLEGEKRVEGKVFIDATGDGQLLSLGNFPSLKGDEKSGELQALTLFFRMGGIDVRKVAEYTKEHKEDFMEWMDFKYDFSSIISIAGFFTPLKKAQQEGRVDDALQYIFFTTLPETGEASFNTSNIIGIDPSTSGALTRAEDVGHKQVAQVTDLLQQEIPGFENSYLIDTAVQVGVRETRRAQTDYMVNGEDILYGAKFDEPIGRASYGVDIHGQKKEDNRMDELEKGSYYEIPKGALMVKETKNLMVAGRCIGSTREGHSALRVMPTSSATGEAAGAVASLAVKNNQGIREVPYDQIRNAIADNLDD
ncbi:MAG: FAD-dependent oxidoreductase [Bacteroidales bacterium]